MAVEAKRGCGYRKVGGLYLVSGVLSSPCGRLPLELHVCPTCKAGIKQSRAWTWVDPVALLTDAKACDVHEVRGAGAQTFARMLAACQSCPLAPANLERMGKQVGLLWIGGSFYPEAADFMREAELMGVSRRIPAVPRGFKVGEHWVLIAHPRAVKRSVPWHEATEEEREACGVANIDKVVAGNVPIPVVRKGIITAFKPTAIEKIVTESQAKDAEAMRALEAKGIRPVAVPDDDPDHQGSVHDKDDDEPAPRDLDDSERYGEAEPRQDPQTGFFA